eukprot:4509212-Lingulodinium_polyedra.AAC.1
MTLAPDLPKVPLEDASATRPFTSALMRLRRFVPRGRGQEGGQRWRPATRCCPPARKTTVRPTA